MKDAEYRRLISLEKVKIAYDRLTIILSELGIRTHGAVQNKKA